MTRFTVKIDCQNDAFDGDCGMRFEVTRILGDLRSRISNGADSFVLQDCNGNTVGVAKFATISTRRKT